MGIRTPVAVGEWYHCYNRGVERRRVFESVKDYERFLLLMYVGNGSNPIHVSNLKERNLYSILSSLSLDRGDPLVEIGAYSLMPNHFHFLLKEIRDGGIASFMQKVFTGYTMYFNKKNERTGALFSGVFKSKHVADDCYLKWLLAYIHLNPVELIEPKWKGGEGNLKEINKYLSNYGYSSLLDFYNSERPEKKLLGESIFELYEEAPALKDMLKEAQEYHQAFIKAKP